MKEKKKETPIINCTVLHTAMLSHDHINFYQIYVKTERVCL